MSNRGDETSEPVNANLGNSVDADEATHNDSHISDGHPESGSDLPSEEEGMALLVFSSAGESAKDGPVTEELTVSIRQSADLPRSSSQRLDHFTPTDAPAVSPSITLDTEQQRLPESDATEAAELGNSLQRTADDCMPFYGKTSTDCEECLIGLNTEDAEDARNIKKLDGDIKHGDEQSEVNLEALRSDDDELGKELEAATKMTAYCNERYKSFKETWNESHVSNTRMIEELDKLTPDWNDLVKDNPALKDAAEAFQAEKTEMEEQEEDAHRTVIEYVDDLNSEVSRLCKENMSLQSELSSTTKVMVEAKMETLTYAKDLQAAKKELKEIREHLKKWQDDEEILERDLECYQDRDRKMKIQSPKLNAQLPTMASGNSSTGLSSAKKFPHKESERGEVTEDSDAQSKLMLLSEAMPSIAPVTSRIQPMIKRRQLIAKDSSRTPPNQIRLPETIPPNSRGSRREATSIESTSPIYYAGPPPVEESLTFSIVRCHLALREMRDERAQHGFRHDDSREALAIAREIWCASSLLSDANVGGKRYFRARGAYLQGISLYYGNEAQRAAPWFHDAGVLDPEAYPANVITAWSERIKEGGPNKNALYYKDHKQPSQRKELPKETPLKTFGDSADDDDDDDDED